MFKLINAARSCSNLRAKLSLFFSVLKQDQNKGTRESSIGKQNQTLGAGPAIFIEQDLVILIKKIKNNENSTPYGKEHPDTICKVMLPK